jgi:hypothetical protein
VLELSLHAEPALQSEGGHCEPNLSFGTLRDEQWRGVLNAL